MNNKQKQIQEIADALYNSQYEYDLSNPFEVAKVVIDLGYRKIPENGVVLTGTETEERLVDLLVDFDEMTFFPLTLCPNPEEYTKEWKQKLIYAIGQLRKETAEKFAEQMPEKVTEFLEEKLKDGDFVNGKTALIEFTVAIVKHIADEICKEMVDGK